MDTETRPATVNMDLPSAKVIIITEYAAHKPGTANKRIQRVSDVHIEDMLSAELPTCRKSMAERPSSQTSEPQVGKPSAKNVWMEYA
jgi:hypothetical protein